MFSEPSAFAPGISDRRLAAFNVLVPLGLLAHLMRWSFILLPGIPAPAGRSHTVVWARATAGWQGSVPSWFTALEILAMAVCAVCIVVKRDRRWVMALSATALLHYFTFPIRTPNHLTVLVVALTTQSLIWLVGRRGAAPALVDGQVVRALAGVMAIAYFFAGLHKINTAFLSGVPGESPGADGLLTFFRNGQLPDPPHWALVVVAAYGTILAECVAPVAALFLPRLRAFLLVFLLLFHFPQHTAIGAIDYPLIATSFFPLFFQRDEWSALCDRLPRVKSIGALVAAVTVGLHLWFSKPINLETVFGAFVAALWGYFAVAAVTQRLSSRRTVEAQDASRAPEPALQAAGAA
jgi:hypothetical protein